MKVNAEKVETNKVKMDIEVDAADFSRAIDEAYHKLVKRTNIPGFRKGKAPRHIFERYMGKGALYEEAFETLFPVVYADAVKEANIEPVDQPDVDVEQMEEGKPLILKASVMVKPEVTLGDYAAVSLARATPEVSTSEVDFQIETLRERQGQLVPVDGPVEKGNFVTMDFAGSIDGVAFPGGTATDYTLDVGSGRFIPGFEDQMIGMAKGETKDIKATFPEDYPAEEIKGKEATFVTTIKEIKKKELPEVNDEFAKSVASKETVEELRKDIENRLLEAKQNQIKRDHENEVIEKIVGESSVEIPEVMIQRRADQMMRDLLERLESRKIALDEYLKIIGQDLEALREEMKQSAVRNVKTDLVIEAVAKKEGIAASKEEMDETVTNLSTVYQQKPEIIRSMLMDQGGLERLEEGIISDKTIAFLGQSAIKNAEKGDARVETPEEKPEK